MIKWLGVGVVVAAEWVGWVHGPAEDHSAIYHHGKDRDGSSVEDHAGGYSADQDGCFHGMDIIHTCHTIHG